MQDLLKTLLESSSPEMKDAVGSLFTTLFENTVGQPSSQDAVKQLSEKVGENVHKTDNGTKVVGLAARAGMGSEPLPGELDAIVNDVNTDIAEDMVLPELPTENDMSGLPTGGGTEEPSEPEEPDFELTPEEADQPVLDEPIPDDLEFQLVPDEGESGSEEPTAE